MILLQATNGPKVRGMPTSDGKSQSTFVSPIVPTRFDSGRAVAIRKAVSRPKGQGCRDQKEF